MKRQALQSERVAVVSCLSRNEPQVIILGTTIIKKEVKSNKIKLKIAVKENKYMVARWVDSCENYGRSTFSAWFVLGTFPGSVWRERDQAMKK